MNQSKQQRKTIQDIQREYGVVIQYDTGIDTFVILEGKIDFFAEFLRDNHSFDHIIVNPYYYGKQYREDGDALKCITDIMKNVEGYNMKVSIGKKGHPYKLIE